MDFHKWLENEEMTWEQEVENTSGQMRIIAVLQKYGAINISVPKLKKKVIVFEIGNQQYVIDDLKHPSPVEAQRWVSDQTWDSRKITQLVYIPDFNKEFWRHPPDVLYHGTTEELWAEIQQSGHLKISKKTRGLSNRFVPPSIFTSADLGTCQYYYDVQLKIKVFEMKADGFMPPVSQEPDVESCGLQNSLAWAIGIEDYQSDCESGMDEGTVIFYQNIPLKYVERLPSKRN